MYEFIAGNQFFQLGGKGKGMLPKNQKN